MNSALPSSQALAEIEEAEFVLKDAQLKPSGTLRIDVPVSFGRPKVVPLLGDFQAQYPDITLRVTFTDRFVDLIEESIDVGVRFGVLQGHLVVARKDLVAALARDRANPRGYRALRRPASRLPHRLEQACSR
jgi:DNA-binding transcriptional LysR family regulator